MRTHVLAPPNEGFVHRLRQLAVVAAEQEIVWAEAARLGLRWRPLRRTSHMSPPYELRPGSCRPGSPDIWAAFDPAVTEMNAVITSGDAMEVASAFGAIASAAATLSSSVATMRRS